MAKQSGLGDNLYVGEFNLSGDVGSVQRVSGGFTAIDVTGLDKSAPERLGGKRDGGIDFSAFFNDATGQAHDALSDLPRTDRIVSYFRGTAVGNPAACLVGKQINYDPSRGNDGALTIGVQAQANAYGLEWCRQLTAGRRTDSAGTNGASIDTAASRDFGAQAYLHVFAFTGTSVTVKIQDSADDAAWADVAGFGFTLVTGVTSERIALANTATVRRYVRVVTTGTFSNLVFACAVNKNEVAGVTF